ncbi:MAG TPA: M67 family metallopeptidase [Thermoanaerobaculia bacterium]|nr:M67 family metallopeptidase [Thermoanaerobaculia bacterium]
MFRLVITPRHLQTITRHGASSYPEECCGFLIGRFDGGVTVVERVLSVGNERQESRHNRYLISPETVLAANKEARGLGLDVVGYYHSHPDHPARPSEFDRDHAWPGLSYVIVSIEGGKVADTRSWRLSDDRERFEEETIEQAAVPAAASGFQKEAVQ